MDDWALFHILCIGQREVEREDRSRWANEDWHGAFEVMQKATAVDGARLAFNMVGRRQRREHGVVDGQRVVATSVWSFKTMAIAVKNRFSGMPL